MGVTVAVTGPTGEIGISAVTALEREPAVDAIVGMSRRPFDPSSRLWLKTTYRQGDILDRNAVDDLVAEADVVIHLAFSIMGSRDESARINLRGSRNVFGATVAANRPRRLVYTSSVAAYGYHSDNPVPLTEDVPARGSDEHYPPGVYNIAGDGVVTIADVARALGGRPVRVPAVAASAASAAISRVPLVPAMLEWLHSARTSVVMDTTKARSQLGWRPLHSSAETLAALASAV